MKATVHSEAELLALGGRVGERLRPGECILLSGEMGAGKSVFTRGMARGMGITEPIPSPTFTIMNVHEGPTRLYHFDFYRLSGPEELYAAGLDEFIPPEDGVAAIEWPDLVPEVLPEGALRLEILAIPEGRICSFTPAGRFDEAWLSTLWMEDEA